MWIREYLKEKWKMLLFEVSFLLFLNFYFVVLCSTRVRLEDLTYLDLLLIFTAVVWGGLDYHAWSRKKAETQEREREGERQKALIRKLEEEQEEMSDYITRWVHEVKLPLASLKLMNERNQDMELANQMQDCIERIGLHLNTMMMNCKRKNLENDVKIEKLCLEDIVQQSLKNQSWFLIKDHFQIETKLEGIEIYGDRRWLVYILDQLIVNAVKYHGEAPKLLFSSDRRGGQADTVQIILEDNGIGILPEDLPYIFDKGYIGSNLRDGDYRSTGMGLYFVKTICDRLGIKISVQSKAGAWTRFILELKDGEEFYFLTEL